jgi:hypothetical protein
VPRIDLPVAVATFRQSAESGELVVADHPLGRELRWVVNGSPLWTMCYKSAQELREQIELALGT